jgi:hypothetical protein
MDNKSQPLTIKYLIKLLNDHTNIIIEKKTYIVDSFQVLKLNSIVSYDSLLFALLIAYKNIKYKINDDFKIYVDQDVVKNEKVNIQKKLFESSIDIGKKKKEINFIINQSNNNAQATNESILMLSFYFGINIILYSSESKTIKCFYYDNLMDRNQPFVIIKETKFSDSPDLYYEIICSQNKFIFEFTDPMIMELVPNAFIVGLEQNKKLEYLEDSKISEIYEDQNIQDDKYIKLSFDDIVNDRTTNVKLKLIPTHVINIIDDLRTMNFDKMKIQHKIKNSC